jgi:hypothetical protein
MTATGWRSFISSAEVKAGFATESTEGTEKISLGICDHDFRAYRYQLHSRKSQVFKTQTHFNSVPSVSSVVNFSYVR